MEFNSEIEEEQYFPYLNMSLEEARLIRYLIINMEVFKNHEIVAMGLKNINDEIRVNGMAYKDGDNLTFNGIAKPRKTGYIVSLIIEEVLSHKDYYSIESFRFNKNSIKVRSKIERCDEVIKEIPYINNGKTNSKGRM